MSRKLLVIRSGETAWDAENRIQGNLDLPLSPEGAQKVGEQAAAMAGLDPHIVWTSESQNAVETAQIVAECVQGKPKVAVCRELNGLDCGLWQGLLVDEVKRKHPKAHKQWRSTPLSVCPPEGETLEHAYARVSAFMEQILKKPKQKTVAIVSSPMIGGFLRCFLKQCDVNDIWNISENAPDWEVIDVPASPAKRQKSSVDVEGG